VAPILFSIAFIFTLNVLTPGVSFVLTARNALSHGAHAGYSVALGLSIADVLFAVVAVVGFSAVIQTNENAISFLGFVGGAWIAATGLKMFRRIQQADLEDGPACSQTTHTLRAWTGIRIGAAAGFSNPQSIIFFAFIAGMAGEPSAGQSLAIVFTIAASSIIVRHSIVRLVMHDAIRRAYAVRHKNIEKVFGAVLIFYGMKLSVTAVVLWSTKAVVMLTSP
jgi:threonine/homoserine/homoserine lactone efflux protein